MRRVHSETEDTSDEDTVHISCPICDRTFCRRAVMYKHMREQHEVEPVLNIPQTTLQCPLCDTMCCTFEDIDIHLHSSHGIDQELEEISFDTEEGNMIPLQTLRITSDLRS